MAVSLGGFAVLLLVTHRPEYRNEWIDKSNFSQIRLKPLNRDESDQLLKHLIGSDFGAKRLGQLLFQKTEGTPFFLEECVRSFYEAGILVGERGSYRLTTSLEDFEIPSTIQAVLAARIDRLSGLTRNLLQIASVVGRDVPLPILQAVAGLDEDILDDLLSELQSAEFLIETRIQPEVEFSFKHALTQEVAYNTVLKERRREIHLELMNTIERIYHDRIEDMSEAT